MINPILLLRAFSIVRLFFTWKLLRHSPTLWRFFIDVKAIVGTCILLKRAPTKKEFSEIVLALALLIDKQIIDFPGIDEHEVAEWLSNFRAEVLEESKK